MSATVIRTIHFAYPLCLKWQSLANLNPYQGKTLYLKWQITLNGNDLKKKMKMNYSKIWKSVKILPFQASVPPLIESVLRTSAK
jgi:hypothetical protein